MWRVGRGGRRGWEQRVERRREGWKRVDAVLDAEESGRGRKRVCDLIGYLIGFVWIWAVFMALDWDWSGLWVWTGCGGCGEWG